MEEHFLWYHGAKCMERHLIREPDLWSMMTLYGALMFFVVGWTSCWANKRVASDLRRHSALVTSLWYNRKRPCMLTHRCCRPLPILLVKPWKIWGTRQYSEGMKIQWRKLWVAGTSGIQRLHRSQSTRDQRTVEGMRALQKMLKCEAIHINKSHNVNKTIMWQ